MLERRVLHVCRAAQQLGGGVEEEQRQEKEIMKFYKLIGEQTTEREVQKSANHIIESCFAGKEEKIATAMMRGEGYLDGSLLEEILFPVVGNKIFISHDHNEDHKAIWLAEKLGWDKCFIDKKLWASADKILVNVQRIAIRTNENGTFPLEELNALASHFYSMLSNAIQMTIAHSRAFLYIPPSHSKEFNGAVYQRSPWINFELLQAKSLYEMLNPGILKESAAQQMNFSSQIKLLYQVDDTFMQDVNLEQLKTSLHML